LAEHEAMSVSEDVRGRFWEKLYERLKQHLPAPDIIVVRKEDLAEHQSAKTNRIVETIHGGKIVQETEHAWGCQFRVDGFHWLPRSQVEIIWSQHDTQEEEYDCVKLPHWLAVNREIDFLDDEE